MAHREFEPELRCLVIGADGQLGRALCGALEAHPRHRLVASWTRSDLDLEALDPAALPAVDPGDADVVVNAAAMTAVDRCEGEAERAERVNAEAPGLLATWCKNQGFGFAHVSTDYVFSGQAERPWREDDPTEPLSVYGQSKLRGEERVRAAHPDATVVRTAWLFGDGANFVRTIIGAARRARSGEGPGLRVVDDQRGSPTYARHLAEGILALLERGERGLYHLAGGGVATWWELARAAVDAIDPALPIEAVSSDAFPRPAPRPAWSALDTSRAAALGVRLPDWRDGLAAYLRGPESPLRLS